MKQLYTLLFAQVFACSLSAQQNLSPAAKWLLLPNVSAAEKQQLLIGNEQKMHCLIQVAEPVDMAALELAGAKIESRAGAVWSISVPLQSLALLSQVKGVAYVDVATRMNAAFVKNDKEQQLTSTDKVHNGIANGLPQNYFGKDVVVGIVDIGFQTNNPTFYNESGTRNRIVRYWHQSYPVGTPPAAYSYGAEHKDSAGIEGQPDENGIHGTHVAGIAAGSGYTSTNLQFRGVAPQADMVFVTIKYSNDTLGGSALGDYVVANPTIIDAYKYIFDYAESVGKPAVINLSWGMHTGPHDGTSLFDKATENLVKRGHILVGANGNEGQNNMHISYQFSNDTMNTFIIENGRQYRTDERVYADFWGTAGSDFSLKITVMDSNLNEVAATPFVSSASDMAQHLVLTNGADNFTISFLCENSFINNNKPNITVMATNPDQLKYYLKLSAISSPGSRIDGWNSGAAREWTSGSFTNNLNKANFSGTYRNGDSESTMGENGGTSKAVISVGATAARNKYDNVLGKTVDDSWYVKIGDITPFSSKGPTIDGRTKPDVAAPGFDVPSAANRTQVPGWMMDKVMEKSVFRGDTNYWVTASGTSMASPHTTGIVALVLEANPELSPEQVRDILRSTADKDTLTGNTPNNRFGWGRVNAFEAVKQALFIKLGINKLSGTDQSLLVFPNPVSQSCNIQVNHFEAGAAGLSVKTLLGQEVLSKQLTINSSGHQETLALDTLAPGLYMITVTQGKQSFSAKLLIN